MSPMFPAEILPWFCVLGTLTSGVALVACVVCPRHTVLLWLGGGLLIGSVGAWVVLPHVAPSFTQSPRSIEYVVLAMMFTTLTLPLLGLTGLILLVGGTVRWGLARWRSRHAPGDDPPEPGDDPEPGNPSAE